MARNLRGRRNSHPSPFPEDFCPMPEVLMTDDKLDEMLKLGLTRSGQPMRPRDR